MLQTVPFLFISFAYTTGMTFPKITQKEIWSSGYFMSRVRCILFDK